MLERPSISSRFAWLYSCSFVLLLPLDELAPLRLPLAELPERLRELLERFAVLPERLFVPEDDERARERFDELEPLRDRCPGERRLVPPLCWLLSPSSSPFPSSF